MLLILEIFHIYDEVLSWGDLFHVGLQNQINLKSIHETKNIKLLFFLKLVIL